jgi:uncharacterized membrane protein
MKPIHWFVGLMLLLLAGLWAYLAKFEGSTAYAVTALAYAMGALLMVGPVRYALGRIIGREVKGGLLLTLMAVFFLVGFFVQNFTDRFFEPPVPEATQPADSSAARPQQQMRAMPTDSTGPDSAARGV